MWDEKRDGPDEVFTLATEILAVDGPTAVVRAEVRYGDPVRQEYRDLWVMQIGDDGRCNSFGALLAGPSLYGQRRIGTAGSDDCP